MSTRPILPPIRPGHPLYACRPSMLSQNLMYGVPLVNQLRSQALFHWMQGQDGAGRDFLPAWDITALRVSKTGNVVVWEKQTEGQGKAGLSARILVEQPFRWLMQVWPNEDPRPEEWAPFTSLTVDPRLLDTPGLDPVNLGWIIQHCFRTHVGKSIRLELLSDKLREGENTVRISIWDVRGGNFIDMERMVIRGTLSR